MTYDEAIAVFGTQVRLAEVLGITQPTVSAWKGEIPKAYQFQLQVLTENTSQPLRVDPRYLPPARVAA